MAVHLDPITMVEFVGSIIGENSKLQEQKRSFFRAKVNVKLGKPVTFLRLKKRP